MAAKKLAGVPTLTQRVDALERTFRAHLAAIEQAERARVDEERRRTQQIMDAIRAARPRRRSVRRCSDRE